MSTQTKMNQQGCHMKASALLLMPSFPTANLASAPYPTTRPPLVLRFSFSHLAPLQVSVGVIV